MMKTTTYKIVLATVLALAGLNAQATAYFCGKTLPNDGLMHYLSDPHIMSGSVVYNSASNTIILNSAVISYDGFSIIDGANVGLNGSSTLINNKEYCISTNRSSNDIIIDGGGGGLVLENTLTMTCKNGINLDDGGSVKIRNLYLIMNATNYGFNVYYSTTNDPVCVEFTYCAGNIQATNGVFNKIGSVITNKTYMLGSNGQLLRWDNGAYYQGTKPCTTLLLQTDKQVNKSLEIPFADPQVKMLCQKNFGILSHNLTLEEAEKVKSLGSVFKGNSEITSFDELRYFTNVRKIDDGAFSACSNLTHVGFTSNITEVGSSAFRGSGLSGAIWSQSIKTIGALAFSQTKITAFYDKYRWDPNPRPTLLNSIGNGAFSNCTLLKTVELSDSLRTIGQSAFQGSAINSISLSGPVTIGWRAFAFTNVRSAELGKPGSYINLGANAFEGCTSLEYAYICCDEDNQFYAQGPFVDENSDAHIYFDGRIYPYILNTVTKSWSQAHRDKCLPFVTFNGKGYATAYFDVDLDLGEWAKAYAVSNYDENKQSLLTTELGSTLPAKTPAIIQRVKYTTDPFVGKRSQFYKATATLAPYKGNNLLVGTSNSINVEPCNNTSSYYLWSPDDNRFNRSSDNKSDNVVDGGAAYVKLPGLKTFTSFYIGDADPSTKKKGDVDGNGEVDITDTNILINIILGKDTASKYSGRADIDGNGTVDITDANLLINILLGK